MKHMGKQHQHVSYEFMSPANTNTVLVNFIFQFSILRSVNGKLNRFVEENTNHVGTLEQ